MKTTKQHFEDLKRFRPMFEALAYFMDDAETFNSLKQAHSETEKRLSEKREQEKAIDGRLEVIAAREKAIGDAETLASVKRSDFENTAKVRADNIIDQAKAQGKKIIESSYADAKNVAAPYELERDNLIATIEYRKKDIAELEAKHAELKANHDKIQDAIATAKAQASHILKA